MLGPLNLIPFVMEICIKERTLQYEFPYTLCLKPYTLKTLYLNYSIHQILNSSITPFHLLPFTYSSPHFITFSACFA